MTAATPSAAPLQETPAATIVSETESGCVTISVSLVMQPRLSVMVTMCWPAVSPLAVSLAMPEGSQSNSYGPVPPAAAMKACPSLPPLHVTGAVEPDTLTGCGCVMVALPSIVQPCASVTVTEYTPAGIPELMLPVCPPGDHTAW